MVNSRMGLFTATLSRLCVLVTFTIPGYLFSRSYEVILPSSLARVISRTLVFSTNLPLAVSGTDNLYSRVRSFSWQCGFNTFCSVEHTRHASVFNKYTDLPVYSTYTLAQPSNRLRAYPTASLRPLNKYMSVQEYQPDNHRLRLSALA